MKFRTQLLQIGIVGFIGALAIGVTSWFTQQTYNKALAVSERNATALRNHLEGDMMHDALRADVQRALLVAIEKDNTQFDDVKSDVSEHSKRFREHIKANKILPLNKASKSALAELDAPLEKYISLAEDQVNLAFTDLNAERSRMEKFNAAFSDLEGKMAIASDKLQAAGEADIASTQSEVRHANWIQATVILLSAAISLFFASKIASRVMGQLGGEPDAAVSIAKKIGSGDYKSDRASVGAPQQSLIGQLEIMRAKLEVNEIATGDNLRVRTALDSTSTNVMISDNERNIVYINKSVESMLRNAEADLRKALPNFSVDKLVGSNMDIFHKNPQHQKRLLESLTATYIGNIVVGGRSFRLIASPIFSDDGTRLGSVVEWLDRTQEVIVEGEISGVVKSACAGNFTARIPTNGKTGFFLNLAEELNSLMNTSEVGLAEVNRVLGAIAKGDLTERITAEYSGTFGDLKNYCNQTTESLTEMMSEIRTAAETIFTASSEIASGNADLSSRTEQQAANLEETASSMEELTSTVKLNADNAKQANVLAEQASSVASDGGNLIQQVVTTMNAINESSQKIADIIGVIDGIAFQTNILALNAAVEAARAGDQGRGFAVVASEVRTLAQRSANAAKDIKALISDSVKKIESGNVLVGKSGDTMKDIVTSIKRVNDIMAEIAAASSEQSAGIDEVSTAVSQMDEMTQQNAALVEEAAAAAESLQSQADQLTQRVAQFRLANDSERNYKRPTPRLPQQLANTQVPKPSKRLSPPGQQDDEWESF